MREALHALTTRGRAFLAGGFTAVLSGMLLGEKDLVRVGLVALLLPIAAAFWVARSGHDLRLHRAVPATQIEVGQRATVHLQVGNLGRRSQLLRLEEQIPYVLGARPRFLVRSLPSDAQRDLEYAVSSDLRGGYTLGPLHLRASDPFGLLELNRSFSATSRLVVTPRVVPLPPISLGGSWSGTGENRPRSFASGNAADVTVREYRRGDELRRVHWRSSAHVGELMVRREEQPWQSRCTLLVDNRLRAHRGRGTGSSLETAIEAAASVATHLSGRGYQVRLVAATGEELDHGWHDGGAESNARGLLGALAVLPSVDVAALATDWVDDTLAGSMFLAVLGAVDEHDRAFLTRIKRAGGLAHALTLDVDEWASSREAAAPSSAAPVLQGLGWKAATLGRGGSLSAAWQELGR